MSDTTQLETLVQLINQIQTDDIDVSALKGRLDDLEGNVNGLEDTVRDIMHEEIDDGAIQSLVQAEIAKARAEDDATESVENPYDPNEIRTTLEQSPVAGGSPYVGTGNGVDPTAADVEVSELGELLDALDDHDTVAIAPGAHIIATGEVLRVQSNQTLCSYRGQGDPPGMIASSTVGQHEGTHYRMIDLEGGGRISGVRLRGRWPDTGWQEWQGDEGTLARGVWIRGQEAHIDNCEVFGWPWTAIYVHGNEARNAIVRNNHIHSSFQLGYGYGVDIGRGHAMIEHNYFNRTRHAIDGFGWPSTSYTARGNVFGPTTYSHAVDMHCLTENNASDNPNPDANEFALRAGGSILVENNTFCYTHDDRDRRQEAIVIRGEPLYWVRIRNNRFAHEEEPPNNSGNDSPGHAWRQVNVHGVSGFDALVPDSEFTDNFETGENQFNAPHSDHTDNFGAPVDLTER